jgi:hypothetical protein
MGHWLVGVDVYGERCSCGVQAPRILVHLSEVALAQLKEAA